VFGDSLRRLRSQTRLPAGILRALYPTMNEPSRSEKSMPNELRLPQAEPAVLTWKLHQQIRRFRSSREGMPPLFAYEDPDGVLEISDGATELPGSRN